MNVSSINSTSNFTSKRNIFGFKKKERKHIELTDTQKKLLVGAGAVAIAAGTAYLIGRDPAKIAKKLTGTNSIDSKAYQEGLEYLNELKKLEGSNYTVSAKDFSSLFKKGEKFDFEEALEGLTKAVGSEEKASNGVIEALKNLQAKTSGILEERKQSFSTTEGIPKLKTLEFLESTKADMDVLREAFSKEGVSDEAQGFFRKLNDAFYAEPDKFHIKINAFEQCPEELLPQDNIYYHGTFKPKKVLKNGINPYKSNQIYFSTIGIPIAREGGAAVYLTPDKKVASYFATPVGKVLAFEAKDCKVAMATQESMLNVNQMAADYLTERAGEDDTFGGGIKWFMDYYKSTRKTVAAKEILTNQIIRENGYDAIYTPGAVSTIKGVDLLDIEYMMGRKESQLICYNTEKLNIVSRNLKQRAGDLANNCVACGKTMVNYFKAVYSTLKCVAEETKEFYGSK